MGTWVLAGVAFKEAARKRILWIALAIGFGFLILFGLGQHFQTFGPRMTPIIRRQIINAQFMVGLYALNFLMLAMAVLTSVDTLSGEIASGTIHAVATKPIRRWEVLFGKWVGFVGMLTVYIVLMVAGITVLTYFQTGYRPHHLLRGLILMWLESLLLLTVTFLFGTLFSTLTNGVLALGLHGLAFLGGWIEQFGSLSHSPRAMNIGVIASVIMPSEVLWRRAAFEMQSPLVGSFGFSPFSNASVPSGAMIAYAGLYAALALGIAIRLFGKRDL